MRKFTMRESVQITKEHFERCAEWHRETIAAEEKSILADAECTHIAVGSVENAIRKIKDNRARLYVYEEVVRMLNDILEGEEVI